MQIKIFFKAPPSKNLRGSGHKITQFKRPNQKFIKIFKQKWFIKKEKYLRYLNKVFINKPKEIHLFISNSSERLGGCDKLKANSYIIYVSDERISPTFFMILFHELCHAYLNNENIAQYNIEEKYRFDVEELLAQLLTLKYFKKLKYVKDIPNSIFKKLPNKKIIKIKNAFKKFNGKTSIIEWFKTIYNPNIS